MTTPIVSTAASGRKKIRFRALLAASFADFGRYFWRVVPLVLALLFVAQLPMTIAQHQMAPTANAEAKANKLKMNQALAGLMAPTEESIREFEKTQADLAQEVEKASQGVGLMIFGLLIYSVAFFIADYIMKYVLLNDGLVGRNYVQNGRAFTLKPWPGLLGASVWQVSKYGLFFLLVAIVVGLPTGLLWGWLSASPNEGLLIGMLAAVVVGAYVNFRLLPYVYAPFYFFKISLGKVWSMTAPFALTTTGVVFKVILTNMVLAIPLIIGLAISSAVVALITGGAAIAVGGAETDGLPLLMFMLISLVQAAMTTVMNYFLCCLFTNHALALVGQPRPYVKFAAPPV